MFEPFHRYPKCRQKFEPSSVANKFFWFFIGTKQNFPVLEKKLGCVCLLHPWAKIGWLTFSKKNGWL
jgi:hypothetical protein